MPHICISELGQHWFILWPVACSVPSHNLNQHWFMVKRTLSNKLQWILNQNTLPFIHEDTIEEVVCEMAFILFKGISVKWPNFVGLIAAMGARLTVSPNSTFNLNSIKFQYSLIKHNNNTNTTYISHVYICSMDKTHDKWSEKLHWCIGSYIISTGSAEVCNIGANIASQEQEKSSTNRNMN